MDFGVANCRILVSVQMWPWFIKSKCSHLCSTSRVCRKPVVFKQLVFNWPALSAICSPRAMWCLSLASTPRALWCLSLAGTHNVVSEWWSQSGRSLT